MAALRVAFAFPASIVLWEADGPFPPPLDPEALASSGDGWTVVRGEGLISLWGSLNHHHLFSDRVNQAMAPICTS